MSRKGVTPLMLKGRHEVKEGARRSSWPLAKVVELLPGSDGVTRAAVVSKNGNQTRRATSLLYPLEAEPPWSDPPALKALEEDESDAASTSGSESSEELDSAPSSSVITRGGRQIRRPARFC